MPDVIKSGGKSKLAPSNRLPKRVRKTTALASKMDYKNIWLARPLERISMVKAGLPAVEAKQIVVDLHMPVTKAGLLGFVPVSTLNRKIKKEERLTPEVSERFLGLAKLIGQVQAMVEESGNPEDFDARDWTARWINEPLPAFGGVKPIEIMDTMEGQALVSATLERMRSGAYA